MSIGIAAVFNSAIILFFLNRELILPGIILGLFILVFYLIRHLAGRNKFLLIPGEIVTMALYIAGTWFGPYLMADGDINSFQALVFLMFSLIIFMNISILSWYDLEMDISLEIKSMAGILGRAHTRRLVFITGGMACVLFILLILRDTSMSYIPYGIMVLVMGTILIWINTASGSMKKNERYRMLADAVLYLGFISLLF